MVVFAFKKALNVFSYSICSLLLSLSLSRSHSLFSFTLLMCCIISALSQINFWVSFLLLKYGIFRTLSPLFRENVTLSAMSSSNSSIYSSVFVVMFAKFVVAVIRLVELRAPVHFTAELSQVLSLWLVTGSPCIPSFSTCRSNALFFVVDLLSSPTNLIYVTNRYYSLCRTPRTALRSEFNVLTQWQFAKISFQLIDNVSSSNR